MTSNLNGFDITLHAVIYEPFVHCTAPPLFDCVRSLATPLHVSRSVDHDDLVCNVTGTFRGILVVSPGRGSLLIDRLSARLSRSSEIGQCSGAQSMGWFSFLSGRMFRIREGPRSWIDGVIRTILRRESVVLSMDFSNN